MFKFTLSFCIVLLSLNATGCGQARDRDEKIVYVDSSSAKSQNASTGLSNDLLSLQQFIELYFEGDAISRDGMAHVLTKYRDKIIPFLKGMDITADELIDILFSFDKNKDGKLGVGELADEIARRVPILKWIGSNTATVTPDELLKAIKAEYPAASHGACLGLQNSLLRFDETWAGGNTDGLISRREISIAGLALAAVAQTDLSKPLSRPAGSSVEEKLQLETLERLLNQQIFGRHSQVAYKELPEADLRLEWAQFYLQSELTSRLAQRYGAGAELDTQGQVAALAAYGFPQRPHWAKLRTLYDNKMLGGDANGKLGFTETMLYLADFKYAAKIWTTAGGNFTSKNIGKLEGRRRLLWSLITTAPHSGAELFTLDGYWDSLIAFDTDELNGNRDGKLDQGELALALAFARLVDNIYALYDTNGDRVLSKPEAGRLFAAMGFDDKRVVDGFFADLGLDGHNPGLWKKLKAYFSGRTDIDRLPPFEFYKRMVKVLPRVLDDETPKPPRRGD